MIGMRNDRNLKMYGMISLLAITASIAWAQTKKPNIVFIFSDDHALNAISAYGVRLAKQLLLLTSISLPKRALFSKTHSALTPSADHHARLFYQVSTAIKMDSSETRG